MKIAIIGSSGQLGTDLCKTLDNEEVIPLTHTDIEITDSASVRTTFTKHKPDIIINTAAYVRVDDCEDNRDKAFNVNALGARNVAVAAQELGAKLVHMSTDYVFGGRKGQNIPYIEFDTQHPINVYGQSKLAGEDFIRHLNTRYFIVRGSGLFGVAGSSGKGGNFVETMLRLGKERDEIRVVNDQVFSPTYTKDLASKIAQLIKTDYYGIFHITNSGSCSWYEFTREIIKLAGLSATVIPIASDQYPQKARRPNYSVLDNYHLKLLSMAELRSWQEALREYIVFRNSSSNE
jgi:dTDP-4-dehydrorhamnose reductase